MQLANNYRRVRGLFEERVEAATFRRTLIGAWRRLSNEQKSGAFLWDQALVAGAIMRERGASFVDLVVSRIAQAVSAARMREVEEATMDLGAISFPMEPLTVSAGRFAFTLDEARIQAIVVRPPKFEGHFGYERNEMRSASKIIRAHGHELGESLGRLAVSAATEANLGQQWLSGMEALAGVYAVVVGGGAEVKSWRVLEAPRMIGDTRAGHDRTRARPDQIVARPLSASAPQQPRPTGPALVYTLVSLEEYCATIKLVMWKDRDWLQAVTNAAWRQAHRLRNYTVPGAHVSFPFESDLAGVIGVHSLAFLGETEDRVTVRFDLTGDRYAKLILHRSRYPNLGDSPVQGLLTAAAVTVYRDCVVASDDRIRSGVELAPKIAPSNGGEPRLSPKRAKPLIVPRMRSTPRRATRDSKDVQIDHHGVVGHRRQLPDGWQASYAQIAEAMTYGMILTPGQTFVRPHFRGVRTTEEDMERTARSRSLSAELFSMIGHGITIN
jgi:hypothetical protein